MGSAMWGLGFSLWTRGEEVAEAHGGLADAAVAILAAYLAFAVIMLAIEVCGVAGSRWWYSCAFSRSARRAALICVLSSAYVSALDCWWLARATI